MKRAIVVPAPMPLAARTELKNWLAISSGNEDAFLESLLRASLDTCEAFTGSMLLEQTCEEFLAPTDRWQALSASPVQSIEMLVAIPTSGSIFLMESDAYEFDIDADGIGRVRLLRPQAMARAQVRYVAGRSANWDSLPDGLRQGVVRLAAHQYRERDGAGTTPPASVAASWRPWRRLRVT